MKVDDICGEKYAKGESLKICQCRTARHLFVQITRRIRYTYENCVTHSRENVHSLQNLSPNIFRTYEIFVRRILHASYNSPMRVSVCLYIA